MSFLSLVLNRYLPVHFKAEMFELRERVAELPDSPFARESVLQELRNAAQALENNMQQAWEERDLKKLSRFAVRLQYLSKVVS